MSIEAMKQALEALEIEDSACRHEKEMTPEHIASSITVLRQAIEQAEQQTHTDHPMRHWDRTCPACVAEAEKQEPVAWMYIEPDNKFKTVHIDDCDYSQFPNDEWFPVYTAPPKREWVGLTDEEIQQVVYDLGTIGDLSHDEFDIARAVIAKLKEKNT